MEEGAFRDEFEGDFYNDQSIQESMEDDEISDSEEGFMRGYLSL
ncbi:MAG TPA: hypothetical protein VI564_00755 [Candidatus Nanoarchaeia archaeon]|nr:hypothetical protein [Candidatus Nanoarchaeia archaeon]